MLHRIPTGQEDIVDDDDVYYDESEAFVPADEVYEQPEHESEGQSVDPKDDSRARTPTRNTERDPLGTQVSNGTQSHYLDPPI